MDLQKLIAQSPPHVPVKWHRTKVVFRGAENYVLGSTYVMARLKPAESGFKISLQEKFAYPCEQLMGKKVRMCGIFDVELEFKDITLCLSKLIPGRFPHWYVPGQVIEIN